MPRSARMLAASIAALFLAGCAESVDVVAGGARVPAPTAAAEATGEPAPVMPMGWRWESFGNVELAVPDTWAHDDSGDQRLTQWCIAETPPPPGVGRPFGSTAVGCGEAAAGGVGDPGTSVAVGGEYVAFRPNNEGLADGRSVVNDRVTVVRGDVVVHIQAWNPIRDRIADTVHTIEVDAAGCPVRDPISTAPLERPKPAVAVTKMRDVIQIAACRYQLGRSVRVGNLDGPTLLSSVLLTGPSAEKVIEALAAAPVGSGPNDPSTCDTSMYGTEAIVLRVASASGWSRVIVRYDWCDHHGADDGVTVHRLTRDWLRPLVGGANSVNQAYGSTSELLLN